MFQIKIIRDDRCKNHLCQDSKHPSIYRCSESLFIKFQRSPLILTDDKLKKHPNHFWLDITKQE